MKRSLAEVSTNQQAVDIRAAGAGGGGEEGGNDGASSGGMTTDFFQASFFCELSCIVVPLDYMANLNPNSATAFPFIGGA